MNRTPFRLGALALLLSFGVMACGDDSPTQSGDTLTQAEAESMMGALALAGGVGFFGMGFAADDPSMAMSMDTFPIDATIDCSGGGTLQMSGEVTVSNQGESISMTQTLTHQSCTETSPQDDRSWTFNGSPSINTQLAGSATDTTINFQGSQTGGISWSSGGSSGTCQMNVDYSVSGSSAGGAVTVNISGTVCGVDVSQSVTTSG